MGVNECVYHFTSEYPISVQFRKSCLNKIILDKLKLKELMNDQDYANLILYRKHTREFTFL